MCPAKSDRPGPLVTPVSALSKDQAARAARQLALPGFDDEAQRRLAAARVLVIGAGGLGSACVPYLVGAGVGTIGVIDDDRVELSNLHRQIAHGTADIGRPKTDSLADTAARLNPAATIVRHQLRLTSANAIELFSDYDLVIDGSDNFATRYLANDAAELTGIPLVWGAILQFHGQVSVAWHRYGPGYRDLFPVPPAPEDVLSCGEGGVLPGLCGTVGSLLATEAMKLITGIGELLIGRVLVYDALASRTREIEYARDPAADPVTELIDYELFCASGGAYGAAPDAVEPSDLSSLLSDEPRPLLIDVRGADEYARYHVPGATLMPLPELESAEPSSLAASIDELAPGAPIIVHCEVDGRSVRAARLLRAAGIDNVRYVRGGIRALSQNEPKLVKWGSD